MFEDENDQNSMELGNQPMEARIANLFRVPQSSGHDDGDFVNRNIGLQVDPATGIAYRLRPGLPGSSMSGQNGQNGQNTGGQAYLPPIQTRDAQGKTLPKYRMGIGHRILATVANFANGFAGNGAAPVYVGPGALNNRYYQDEAFRQQQNAENPALQGSGDRYRQTIDWRTIVQDPISKKWFGRTYGGQKQEIGTPPWATAEDDGDDGNNNDDAAGTVVPPGREGGSVRERFAQARGAGSGNKLQGRHGSPNR